MSRVDRQCRRCNVQTSHTVQTQAEGVLVFQCSECGQKVRLLPTDPDRDKRIPWSELDREVEALLRETPTPKEAEAGPVHLSLLGLIGESYRGNDKLGLLVRRNLFGESNYESRQLRIALPPALWEGVIGLATEVRIPPGQLVAVALYAVAFILRVRSDRLKPQLLAYVRSTKKHDAADRTTKRVRINLPVPAWDVFEHLAQASRQPLETVVSRLVSTAMLLGEAIRLNDYYAKRRGERDPLADFEYGDWLEQNPQRGYLGAEDIFGDEGEVAGWVLEDAEMER